MCKFCTSGQNSWEVVEDVSKIIFNRTEEYDRALEQLGYLANVLFATIDTTVKWKLDGVLEDSSNLVKGIHVARQMLVCLTETFNPDQLKEAAGNQEQAKEPEQ
jgi:3-deoxy-D-arabino-heptulosonate 7-phosphate (DAHP) synthase